MADRPVLNLLYTVQRAVWRLLRPRTRGVKLMLFNGVGQLVLIRHTYGRSDLFVLPGGGVRPFENPAAAAAREAREELGLHVSELKLVSEHFSSAEGKRDTIYLFEGRVDGGLELDAFELQEARFAELSDLPNATSSATRRRVEEYRGVRKLDGSW